MTLYRVVGLNEARDIELTGGFRLYPSQSFEGGKWFAASCDDAVRWGRAIQRFPSPRPFRIAALSVPLEALAGIEYHRQWDAIGPAYYVRADQLPTLNTSGTAIVFAAVYEIEDAP